MRLFYRFSDKGKDPVNFGYKHNKFYCFASFINSFKDKHIDLFLDNCKKETIEKFKGLKDYASNISNGSIDIHITELGNSAGALHVFKYAIEKYPEDDYYFSEDDYLYKDLDCQSILEEGLLYADYCSLYDHGDKYPLFNRQPNPEIKGIGEETILYRTSSTHWKYTNSTTMTFAVRNDVLKSDIDIIKAHCIGSAPLDYHMFIKLRDKNRTIATPVPGLSTHLSPDHENSSPFFNIINNEVFN